MAADPILIIATQTRLVPARAQAGAIRSAAADYWALTKPEVNLLIAMATFTGFYLACPGPLHDFPWLLLVHTLLGTLLVASGTGTLNQYVERRFDAQMRRTARRPLAAGRLKPAAVLWFGIALAAIGCIYLSTAVNVFASLLALLTLLSYLFLYTPLKRKTPLCILVGAFPGAMPPLIGWAAASGRLSLHAWILYAILFLWQFPHFMAIAWIYREDYGRAGIRMLPVLEPDGRVTGQQIIAYSVMLLPVSLLPAVLGLSGKIYLIAAFVLGLLFVASSVRAALSKSNQHARQLLLASVLYLPILFGVMVLNR